MQNNQFLTQNTGSPKSQHKYMETIQHPTYISCDLYCALVHIEKLDANHTVVNQSEEQARLNTNVVGLYIFKYHAEHIYLT